MKTNTGLVKYAEKALKENWGYCLGTFGSILTPGLLNQKLNQGYGVGAYNTRHQAYIRKFMNKRVSDCYGLVKGYLWTRPDGTVPYNASQDRNQEGAYRAAREKGPLSNMPEIPGLVLWMKGHAGVYIGNGDFIEIAGAPKGMQKGKIINGRVAKGSPFTHWFKDTYITYVGPTKPIAPIGPVKPAPPIHNKNIVKINYRGKLVELDGVFQNDKNYASVRELAELLGYKVDWEQATKTVVIK